MGGVFSIHGRDGKCIQNFGLENVKGRYHLEDLGIGRRIILDLKEIGWENMDWIIWLTSGGLL
jgi:hypothetical protein